MRNQDDPVDRYPFTAIDHVQLAMPTGEEDRARAFYCTLLGMTELPKPQEPVKRVWLLVWERKRATASGN
jgi:4-hydroxyphenylpyruvate dioxygenase-like putative hemolysin